MQNDEFMSVFWPDFRARFPWKVNVIGKADVLAVWQKLLRDVELRDAMLAVEYLHEGFYDLPEDIDQIPIVIRNRAQQLASKREAHDVAESSHVEHEHVTGRPTNCWCGGTGIVLCYENRQVHSFANGETIKAWYRIGLPCCCHLGDKPSMWNEPTRGKSKVEHLKRFDPNQWCRYDLRGKHEETITQWLTTRTETAAT